MQSKRTKTVPVFEVPTLQIPQPDGGILVKAGKPVLAPEYISTREAARILGFSQRTIEHQCTVGDFKTAHKPGIRPSSRWRIARSEVMARKEPSAE